MCCCRLDLIYFQPAHNVPGTYPEEPLNVLTSRNYRGLSGDSQGANTKTDDLMEKLLFRSNSSCIAYLFLCFTFLQEEQIFKSSKQGRPRDVYESSYGTSQGPNDRTFQGRPRDFGQTLLLNSIQKHTKFTLTGY